MMQGGGFAIPAGPAHFRLLFSLIQKASTESLSLRALVLHYGKSCKNESIIESGQI